MKPRLFAELCCGSAAVTLRLLGGPHAKPPVSYQGSKRGYAEAILDVLGLRAGIGADAVLLCDPGPWSSVWRVLSTPEGCREVARIIRGWAGEEPRALWERLRAEGPLQGKEGAAQYVTLTASNRLINADWRSGTWANTGKGGTTFGGEEFATPAGEVVEAVSALERIAWPREVAGWLQLSAQTRPDGQYDIVRSEGAHAQSATRWPSTAILSASAASIDPREVAAWLFCHQGSFSHKGMHAGIGRPEGAPPRPTFGGERPAIDEVGTSLDSIEPMAWPPLAIATDARHPIPDRLPEGCIVYLDPPYSDVAPMIPPMLAAERLPLGRIGRAEGDAALDAVGLDSIREVVGHLRVAVCEVFRTIGVKVEVLDSVVERVVIDVVDDLLWTQWAADVGLHYKPVLKDVPALVSQPFVAIHHPPLALASPALGGQRLPLGRHLRDFALRCQSLSGTTPKFTEALSWADRWFATMGANLRRSADLAGDLERHCILRCRVRLDTNTKLTSPGSKVTGYAHNLPRSEVLEIARCWSDAGAIVCISEAEPMPLPGWHEVEITAERVGQKRTFSKQQREFLTLNRPPVVRFDGQATLFAVGALRVD